MTVGAGTDPARLRHLPLRRAARVVGVDRRRPHPATASATLARARRTAASSHTRKTSMPGGSAVTPAVLHREQQALDPGAEADPGRRRAADLLDEAVVAPAARDRRVARRRAGRRTPRSCACSSRGRGRASARGRSATPQASSTPPDRGEVLDAGVAQRLADRRRARRARPAPRPASRRGCRTPAAGSCRPSPACPRRARPSCSCEPAARAARGRRAGTSRPRSS